MMNAIWAIFELFTYLLDVSIYLWFFKKISYTIKIKNKILLLCSITILIFVIGICDYLKIVPTLKLFLFMLIGSILITINFKLTINKIIVGNLIWFINVIMCETIILGILMWIYGYGNVEILLEKNIIRFGAIFITKILFFNFLLFVIRKLNPTEWKFNAKGIMLLFIQAISSVILILITMEVAVTLDKVFNIPSYYFSILAIICLCAYFLSFWLTEKYFINVEKEKEYLKMNFYVEKQMQYYEMKKESMDQIRKIYHDLKYHINAINEMKEKNIVEIQDYVDEIKHNIKQNECYYNTGNIVIDMILSEKKDQAEELGIEIDVRIEPFCLEGYKTIYLCSIFSNALDNAIEASKDIIREDKKVKIIIAKNNDDVSIIISNLYEGERKMNFGRFLTTKPNNEMHGWGMANIIDSVEKCGGRMDVKIEENIFSLFILLSNKNK